MYDTWEEKYLASVIMNVIGAALVFFGFLSECLGNHGLSLFFSLSGIICCNVACVNL